MRHVLYCLLAGLLLAASQPAAANNAAVPALPDPAVNAAAASPQQPPARIQPDAGARDGELEAVAKALMVLLVLAVIVENALAPLFDWRLFLARLDRRGVKMPVTVAASLLVAFIAHPDAVQKILLAYGEDISSPDVLRVLDGFVIAGGSAGVHRIMVALGFRSPVTTPDEEPKPPPTKAWLSVALLRNQAQGAVTVKLQEGAGASFEAAGAITGGTKGARHRPRTLRSDLLRNDDRVPAFGGLEVPPGTDITVRLTDERGVDKDWGPMALREGAILDVDINF